MKQQVTNEQGWMSEQQSRNNSGSKSKSDVAVMHLRLADVGEKRPLLQDFDMVLVYSFYNNSFGKYRDFKFVLLIVV